MYIVDLDTPTNWWQIPYKQLRQTVFFWGGGVKVLLTSVNICFTIFTCHIPGRAQIDEGSPLHLMLCLSPEIDDRVGQDIEWYEYL